MIEDVLRRERAAHPGSQPWFWRTAAGAEIDLVIERGDVRVAVEVKTGRPHGRAVRTLAEAMADAGAARAWIVDQAPGIEALAPRIARTGFDEVRTGTP